MNLKSVIRPVVPPLLYGAAHQIKTRYFPPTEAPKFPSFSPRESFSRAAEECGAGYDDERLLSKFHAGQVDIESGMPAPYAALLASIAAAWIDRQRDKIRVLDFGGAAGHLRSLVATFFGGNIPTDWTIVETESQVRYAGDLGRPDVRYARELEKRGAYDFALFSGSLQYLEDWRTPLRSIDADMIFIARTPVADTEKAFVQRTLRDGYPVCYPGRVICARDLESLLTETHSIFARWDMDAHLLEMGVHESPAMLWKRRA